MNKALERVLIYGGAAIVTGGLYYGGFVYSPPPDLGTILGAVDIQLRMAYGLPAVDKEGRRFTERDRMLGDIARLLDQAEAQRPDYAPVAEYRGFLLHLQGDYRGAAETYRAARSMEACSVELRDSLVFNEARMLTEAGAPAEALEVHEAHRSELQAKYLAQADLDRARLLAEVGRKDDAIGLARSVGANGAEDPTAAVRAGEILEGLGQPEAAETAYRNAAENAPVANYYRGRLKAGQGDVDRALELLELAAAADASTVRLLVEKDPQAWEALAGTARFRELAGSPDSAARPGR